MAKLSRRSFLRGSLQGAMVGMGLPLLNCFLNDTGAVWHMDLGMWSYSGTMGA
jgi:hypothetical protein